MNLILNRKFKGTEYTIGDLFIDGVFFCNTLEDTDRGLTKSMSESEIAKIKIKGITAIPTGTYNIDLNTVSPRFKSSKLYTSIEGKLPRLDPVPGFAGVLIHIGNYPKDTDGCILVGNNSVKGQITNSTSTFNSLYMKLKEAKNKGEKLTITIK